MKICNLRTWLTILIATIALASTAVAQSACKVTYTITPQNTTNYGAAITIANTGTTAISSWTLGWSFANGQTITSFWNGTESQSGTKVTVTNVSYNGSIAAGGSVTGIGFNGTWNGTTNAIPASFTLNGTVCSGGSATPGFTLAPSSSTLSVAQGASATDTITVTDVGGFTGDVTLAASGLPTGVKATFGTNPTTGSSVVTFTATSTATATTTAATATITGTSGTLTSTTTIALSVITPGAVLTSPTPGSTLYSSAATFTWSAGSGVSHYKLILGTTAGASNIYNSYTTTATSAKVTGIPTTSGTLYATLYSQIGSVWSSNAYTYSTGASATKSVLTSPTPSSTLTGSTANFAWTSGTGVSAYKLILGTTLGGSDVYNSYTTTATSAKVTSVPTTGATLYATLYSEISGAWSSNAYTYTEYKAVSNPSFTLTPASSAVTVALGAGATDVITITNLGGFTGSVTLSASGAPSGVTASMSPSITSSGSSTLTLLASSTATTGKSTLTIQGTATIGTVTKIVTTTIALTVSSTPQLTIAWVSPSSGAVGSALTIIPAAVGASFGSTQGSSSILFGTTKATVTSWAINSITVTVPTLTAGSVNVTATVNGVTSNTVPFTVTSTEPATPLFTGNSTWFQGLGDPYGGCGVPQADIDSQNFIALNVQNTPGDYTTMLTRPISSEYASEIGLFNNGLNCGRWVHVTIGDYCNGTNSGNTDTAFCYSGVGWVADQYNDAELDMVVADSCQDSNAWCRDDPYHIDQSEASLDLYQLNGAATSDLLNNWNNRQVHWEFEAAPNYTGDIKIGFIESASPTWSPVAITHLQNGIHSVQYYSGGSWQSAKMDSDMGEDYVILPMVANGSQYQIRVTDVTDTLINKGRIYSFSYPTSCGTSCGTAYTAVTYTTSN